MTGSAIALAKVIEDLNDGWLPHPQQQAVLNALFLHLESLVFVECGRKFGKTEVMAYFLWRRALMNPGGHYYFAPEQKQAKEIVWASGRIQGFGPQKYISNINNTEMRITIDGPFGRSFIKVDGSDNFNAYRGVEPHSAVYDEFRDFRPEFHKAMGPNLGVYQAPLLICSTPPEALEVEGYDSMKVGLEEEKNYFNYPGWANPHMSKDWLRAEKAKLYARGEGDVWEREWGAKRVQGGSNAIFPMFKAPNPKMGLTHTVHVRPHEEIMAEILRSKPRKLEWQVIADPGTTSCFGVLFRVINPYTRRVYRLAEIYEKSQAETSTSKIMPRIIAIRNELYPNWETDGIWWQQIYDEAAAWFATEVQSSFPEELPWTPTQKATKDKKAGLSLLKDQLLNKVEGQPEAYLTVISDRCPSLIKEIAGYIRDKDGKIPKENDHLIDCLAGDQLVHTAQGLVPIAEICPGDLVRTRDGLRPVLAQWAVGTRDIIRLRFSNGKHLDCTPEHLIFTENRGFVPARDLKQTDQLLGDLQWLSVSSSTGSSFDATQTPIAAPIASISARTQTSTVSGFATCMSRFGRRLTARFQRVITSIIATGTRSITLSTISNASRLENTFQNITWASRRQPNAITWTAFANWLRLGTDLRLVAHGIANKGSEPWRLAIQSHLHANNAGRHLSPRASPAFAATIASLHTEEDRGSITRPGIARGAAKHSASIATPSNGTAPRLVAVEPVGRATVYDITVAESREFYAEGILVHNCDRYGNDYAACDLAPKTEPEATDPDDLPRAKSIEQDYEDTYGDVFELDF